jgi:hypothetical protein
MADYKSTEEIDKALGEYYENTSGQGDGSASTNPYPTGTFEHDLYNDPRGRDLSPDQFAATVVAQAQGASGSQIEDILSKRSDVSLVPQPPEYVRERVRNIPGKDFKKPKGVTLNDAITTKEIGQLRKANPQFKGMTNAQIRDFVRPQYREPPPIPIPIPIPPNVPRPVIPPTEEPITRINPFVSAFTPTSFAAPPPPPIVKTPERGLILFQENVDASSLEKLLFENIGGIEIVNFARHDTIEGTNQSFNILSNLSRLRVQIDPISLIARQKTSLTPADFGKSIALFTRIPLSDYLEDIGVNDYIFIDDDDNSQTYGNLIIELVNLDGDELVEVEIAKTGTIYQVEQ